MAEILQRKTIKKINADPSPVEKKNHMNKKWERELYSRTKLSPKPEPVVTASQVNLVRMNYKIEIDRDSIIIYWIFSRTSRLQPSQPLMIKNLFLI
jgi:hypothetical protein